MYLKNAKFQNKELFIFKSIVASPSNVVNAYFATAVPYSKYS